MIFASASLYVWRMSQVSKIIWRRLPYLELEIVASSTPFGCCFRQPQDNAFSSLLDYI